MAKAQGMVSIDTYRISIDTNICVLCRFNTQGVSIDTENYLGIDRYRHRKTRRRFDTQGTSSNDSGFYLGYRSIPMGIDRYPSLLARNPRPSRAYKRPGWPLCSHIRYLHILKSQNISFLSILVFLSCSSSTQEHSKIVRVKD